MQFTKHCQLEVQVRYYIFLTLPVFHSATKWLSLDSSIYPRDSLTLTVGNVSKKLSVLIQDVNTARSVVCYKYPTLAVCGDATWIE